MKQRFTFALCVLLLGASIMAHAQELRISGIIQDAKDKQRIPGARVLVVGSKTGANSNAQGEFRLPIVKASSAKLVVSFIGYKSKEVIVNASIDNLVIAIEEDVLKTSEVVVTGLASGVKRVNSPNSVGTISAKELIPAPAQTVDQAFAGKFAGITIRQNTGAPGGGMSVNLRGTTTIVGDGQPLYIIDGVVMSNDAIQGGLDAITEATGVGSTRPQGQPSNRLADLNPADIEDVQVLKGGSAAAIYGSKAAAGVIIITTKRGSAGKTTVDVSQQIGYNSILRKAGMYQYQNSQEAVAQFGANINIDGVNYSTASLLAQNPFIDYEDLLYGQKGLISETSIGVRGGNERTQFYIGGMARTEDGIMRNTGFSRYNARINVSQVITDNLNADIGVSLSNSVSNRAFTGNSNGNSVSIPYALMFLPTFVDIRQRADGSYPSHPFNGANPLEIIDRMRNTEQVNRAILSAKIDWKIITSETQELRMIASGGFDFFNQKNLITSPIGTQHERANPNSGQVVDNRAISVFSNVFWNLIHTFNASEGLSFKTTGGLQFENRRVDAVLSRGQGYATVTDNLNGAAVVNINQFITPRYDRGVFLQEEIDIDSKFFFTASIRGDQSSAFGNPSQFFWFPKVAGSVRLSQFDFWQSLKGTFEEFKVRASYGQSGNQPVPLAKYGGLVQNNISGVGVGLIPPTQRGNPNLRPERNAELEFGVDFTLPNSLLSVEFTYYTRTISDLVLLNELPRASGFANQFENAGTMSSNGIELALNINPIRTDDFDWNARLNFFTTRQNITQLGVSPYFTGGFGAALGAYRIQEGFSPTSIVGSQSLTAGSFNGTVVGNAIPNFTLGWSNTVRYKDVSFYFLWDWAQGGNTVNLSRFLSDLGGVTVDGPSAWAMRGDMRRGRGAFAGNPQTPWVEDATALRLRELNLSYNFNRDVVYSVFGDAITHLRIGLTARNVLLFTKYSGYDPEVSNFGNIAVGGNIEVTPFPSTRSVFFNIALGF